MADLNLYFPGDSSISPPVDMSGNGIDATDSSVLVSEPDGVGGYRYNMATGDYILLDSGLPVGEVSISVVLTETAPIATSIIMDLFVGAGITHKWFDITRSSAGEWAIDDFTAPVVFGSTGLLDNSLVVITIDAALDISLFVDAQLVGTVSGCFNPGDSLLETDIPYEWAGYVSQLAVWAGVLSVSDQQALTTLTPLQVAYPVAAVELVVVPSVPARWRLTLTGTPDATTDLLLPCVSLQARLRSGSQSYFSAVIPYTPSLAVGLAARPNGDLVLEHISADTTTVITVPLDSGQPVLGTNSASINITGWRQSTNSTPGSHDVQPTTTTNGAAGKRSWSAENFDPAIRPGDTINYNGESVIIDTISVQISIGREAVQYSEA